MSRHWIFVVADHHVGKSKIYAEDVLRVRTKCRLWFFRRGTPNLRHLREGDEVIFYVGGKRGGWFGGRCTIKRGPTMLGPKEKRLSQWTTGKPYDMLVELAPAELWVRLKPSKDLLHSLSFIKNKRNWKAHFQVGIVSIPPEDHKKIVEFVLLAPTIKPNYEVAR